MLDPALRFGELPPEINSTLMYLGPGSAPLLAAASAWNCIATELESAALSYDAILSVLTEHWCGPASLAMEAAAATHISWLNCTSQNASHTAAQAEAAAAAYEVAFTFTIPPELVALNRIARVLLVATNFLDMHAAEIAANEAEYDDMWIQDAAAMYGYATVSRAATELCPFMHPQQIINSEGLGAQTAAVSQAAVRGTRLVVQSLCDLGLVGRGPL